MLYMHFITLETFPHPNHSLPRPFTSDAHSSSASPLALAIQPPQRRPKLLQVLMQRLAGARRHLRGRCLDKRQKRPPVLAVRRVRDEGPGGPRVVVVVVVLLLVVVVLLRRSARRRGGGGEGRGRGLPAGVVVVVMVVVPRCLPVRAHALIVAAAAAPMAIVVVVVLPVPTAVVVVVVMMATVRGVVARPARDGLEPVPHRGILLDQRLDARLRALHGLRQAPGGTGGGGRRGGGAPPGRLALVVAVALPLRRLLA